MELLFIVAGPFLGDWGLEGWSGTQGRTATAGGGSVRSVCGDSGAGWEVVAEPNNKDSKYTILNDKKKLLANFLQNKQAFNILFDIAP